MITTVHLNTIGDVMEMIADQTRDEKINRLRSDYYYRGQRNVAYKMRTSLYRNCGAKQKELERPILQYFTKYASIEDPTLNESVWKQMIMGQHYGLPTRLLDWTRSPLVALHFAMDETTFNKMDKRDCVVWRMNIKDLNRNLPDRYKQALSQRHTSTFSVELLHSVVDSLEQYDRDMGTCTMASLEPPSISQRIINQYSFFSVIPSGITDIEAFFDEHTEETVRFVISKDIRWDLRDLLDQYNVNERIVYPGLDGLSKWITRHYYVREDINGPIQTTNTKGQQET
ncbi:MAG: FRG domain-containing protein [Clostridia bacterium]|nr:FRG domain-containing protein [Clostridia bacterium]